MKIKRMASCKRGFIIVDISEKGETPSEELPTDCWPTVVLTSPDVNHYDSWMKDRDGELIYVNCDDERDPMSFVAWKVLRGLPDKTERNAGLWLYAEKVLKEQLKVLDERIKTVGPLPRFVLDRDSYKSRIIQVGQAISETALDKAQYMGILMKNSEWQPDHASRKLVELVRVRGDLNDETYKCVPLSSKIHETVKIKMLQTLKDTWVLLRLAPSERRAGVGLELLSFDAFLYYDVTRVVVDKLVYLQRNGETRKKKRAC
ncbi:hypothetical protein TRVL_08171 [Trypanosoma vivax]|nr:hypothetical protein TRVL_08171 [Trypanosoma vivax]